MGAFQDIAAAGASNEATFISRSDNSGTNVEEHEIWALTSGVTTLHREHGERWRYDARHRYR